MKIIRRLMLLAWLGLRSTHAQTATYFVTDPTDGTGPNTLRAMIQHVNTLMGGTYDIVLNLPSGTLIPLQSPLPALQIQTRIRGSGTQGIDGGGVHPGPEFNAQGGLEQMRVVRSVVGARGDLIELRDVVFEDCSAPEGGAVYGRPRTIDRCSFLNCSATTGAGGAVRVIGPVTLNLMNSTFHNCSAATRGGALATSHAVNLDARHNTIYENSAGSGGGGIALTSTGDVANLRGNILSGNQAPVDPQVFTTAGAQMLQPLANFIGGNPRLRDIEGGSTLLPHHDSPVIDALASSPGLTSFDGRGRDRTLGPGVDLGAVEVDRIEITSPNGGNAAGDLTREIRSASRDYFILNPPGGVITLQPTVPALAENIVFSGRVISRGPAAVIVDGQHTQRIGSIFGSLWFENIVFRRLASGASSLAPIRLVLLDAGDEIRFTGCRFEDCRGYPADEGVLNLGMATGSRTRLENCFFQGNVGKYAGAVRQFRGNVEVYNCTFLDNRAEHLAGALSLGDDLGNGGADVRHCTFIGNSVTNHTAGAGAVRVAASISGSLANTVLYGNIAGGLGADAGNDSPNFTERSNHFTFQGDPLLGSLASDGNTRVRAPQPGSPLINRADPSWSLPRDQRGAARPEMGLPDIGAVEFYNDPYRLHLARAWEAEELDSPASGVLAWGPAADGDGDGEPCLSEEIFNGDPKLPDVRSTHEPSGVLEIGPDRHLAASLYLRWWDVRPAPPHTFTVDWTSNPVQFWQPAVHNPAPTEPAGFTFTQSIASAELHRREYVFYPPLAASPSRRYFRFHVAAPRLLPMIWRAVVHPGNAPDGNGLGAVASPYAIGAYEVTNAEYAFFLNQADPSGANILELWDAQMAGVPPGGILRNLSAPHGRKYQVAPGRDLHPVVFVTFYNALRLCNWLHNGGIPASSLNLGAYTLPNEAAPANSTSITRNPGATCFLPNRHEWIKAAYHNPAGPGYFDYPTGANTINTSLPAGDGHSANLHPGGLMITGLRPAASYQTFTPVRGRDFAGNAAEFIEPTSPSDTLIVTGGGAHNTPASAALRVNFGLDAVTRAQRSSTVGIRLATPVPESW